MSSRALSLPQTAPHITLRLQLQQVIASCLQHDKSAANALLHSMASCDDMVTCDACLLLLQYALRGDQLADTMQLTQLLVRQLLSDMAMLAMHTRTRCE